MEFKELGAVPIAGPSPAGSDIRTGELFDRLSTEIEKMSSPSAAGAIDWERTRDICADILASSSKDLLVASYMSIALLKTEGLKGLITGVRIWRDILATYWETLFPAKARMRGRRNAVEWWVEKTSAAIRGFEPQTWTAQEIETLYGDLDAIDSFLRENMDDAPTVGPLMSILGSVISAPAEKPAEAPAAPKMAEPAPQKATVTTTPKAPSIEPVPTGDDPEPLIRHGLETLRTAAGLLAALDSPADGLYFRINRAVAWMTVTALPPSHGGRTMIEPPDEEVRDSLMSMHQSGSWKNLLAAAESRLSQYLFWLDLSRYVAEALEKTGLKPLADEVAGLTALYVKRLSGIERLTFADGTPFADAATKKWLADAAGPSTSSGQGTADDVLAKVEADGAAAQVLADGGNLAQAIGQLSGAMMRASSIRERFIRQVRLCRFLLANNQSRVSASYFGELVALIDAYRLGEWEPLLAAEAYEMILEGIATTDAAELKELRPDMFRRLSLLDPVRAMNYA